jgi:hypothetical protein
VVDVLKHRRTVHDYTIVGGSAKSLPNFRRKLWRVEAWKCQRRTRKEIRYRSKLLQARIDARDLDLAAVSPDRVLVFQIGCVINESEQIYVMAGSGERTQVMKGSDLLAFVGRVGNAVAEIRDFHF